MRRFRIRPIEARDDPAMAGVIRAVMPEFGADGPGFALHDPEVDFLSLAFGTPRSAYFVVIDGSDRVLGGGGVAPLVGAGDEVCELKKMYFLPELRGHGMGKALLVVCLERARQLDYRMCYLETLTGMIAAQRLYEQLGFERRCAPLGSTGHFGCDRWYQRSLDTALPTGPS